MAARRYGVSVPDVCEAFGVSRWAALRFLRSLCKEGIIYKTTEKRRRLEVIGTGWPGAPVAVYRARRS
jgi:hypothetical protein